MQRVNVLAFDDIVSGDAYTAEHYNKLLGEYDQLNLEAVVDQATSATGAALTVAIEHSGDGRNWLQKNAAPEINGVALGTGPVTTVLTGFDANTKPSLGFVRLMVSVRNSASGTPMTGKVKIHVTARDRGVGQVIKEHVEIPANSIMQAAVLERRDATNLTIGMANDGGTCAREDIRNMQAAVEYCWETGCWMWP